MNDLIERLSQQTGQVGQAQWDLPQHGHLVPKPRYVGPPWSNQNDPLARKYLVGSPATSPPLCPRWLPVGRFKGPPLTMVGDLLPAIQIEAICC